jgi:hypothetical protein
MTEHWSEAGIVTKVNDWNYSVCYFLMLYIKYSHRVQKEAEVNQNKSNAKITEKRIWIALTRYLTKNWGVIEITAFIIQRKLLLTRKYLYLRTYVTTYDACDAWRRDTMAPSFCKLLRSLSPETLKTTRKKTASLLVMARKGGKLGWSGHSAMLKNGSQRILL